FLWRTAARSLEYSRRIDQALRTNCPGEPCRMQIQPRAPHVEPRFWTHWTTWLKLTRSADPL
ncbi:MAG TPA: hypothetical protein VGB31_05885, partial [Myxococcota bacterium]